MKIYSTKIYLGYHNARSNDLVRYKSFINGVFLFVWEKNIIFRLYLYLSLFIYIKTTTSFLIYYCAEKQSHWAFCIVFDLSKYTVKYGLFYRLLHTNLINKQNILLLWCRIKLVWVLSISVYRDCAWFKLSAFFIEVNCTKITFICFIE